MQCNVCNVIPCNVCNVMYVVMYICMYSNIDHYFPGTVPRDERGDRPGTKKKGGSINPHGENW